jgi:hypothetical protein
VNVFVIKDQILTIAAIVPRHTQGNLIEDRKPLLTSQLSRMKLSVPDYRTNVGPMQAGKDLLWLPQ